MLIAMKGIFDEHVAELRRGTVPSAWRKTLAFLLTVLAMSVIGLLVFIVIL
jgi:hypothetical protein